MSQVEAHELSQDLSIKHATMTLDEFLENDVEGYEFIKGELVPIAGTSRRHGRINVNILRYLDPQVYNSKLGELYTSETSFKVGERVLKPDLAFITAERLDVDEDKGLPIPPDLAIEVVSPSDIHSRIIGKVFAYLDAGTRCVWIVDPVSKTVTVYKSDTDIKIFTREDTLTGDDVVPGFSCPVELLFE